MKFMKLIISVKNLNQNAFLLRNDSNNTDKISEIIAQMLHLNKLIPSLLDRDNKKYSAIISFLEQLRNGKHLLDLLDLIDVIQNIYDYKVKEGNFILSEERRTELLSTVPKILYQPGGYAVREEQKIRGNWPSISS